MAKDKIKDFELDLNNEMEEGILINRVPETIVNLDKSRDGSPVQPFRYHDIEVKSGPDWTHNKPKAKQMQDVIEKQLKTLDQLKEIFKSNLEFSTKNQETIKEVLSKQDQDTLKVYLFRRLDRVYFADKLCIMEIITKLTLFIKLAQFLYAEMDWLNQTFYKDENIDKQISIEMKQMIFEFMRVVKKTEVCIRVLTMESVCTSLFKQFQVVQLLYTDKYPDFKTSATLDDIHSWQTSIRKGSKKLIADEENPMPRTPIRENKEIGTNELHPDSYERPDSPGKSMTSFMPLSPKRNSNR